MLNNIFEVLLKPQIISMKNLPSFLIIFFVVQGIIYSGMYPLWEGWDEPAHFGYVQHIAEKKTIPKLTDEISNGRGTPFKIVVKSPDKENVAEFR